MGIESPETNLAVIRDGLRFAHPVSAESGYRLSRSCGLGRLSQTLTILWTLRVARVSSSKSFVPTVSGLKFWGRSIWNKTSV